MYLLRFGILLFQVSMHWYYRERKLKDFEQIDSHLIKLVHPLLRPLSILDQQYKGKVSQVLEENSFENVNQLLDVSKIQAVMTVNTVNILTLGLAFPPLAVIIFVDTVIDFAFFKGLIGYFSNKIEGLEAENRRAFYKYLLQR